LTGLTDQEVIALIRPVNAGLKLLTFRVEVAMLCLLTCGLFAWSCYDPSLVRVLAASLYALFSLAIIRNTHPQVTYAEGSLPPQ